MQNFRKILFVSHGTVDESDGLMQALSVARVSGAPLTIVVVCPDLPDGFTEYEGAYTDGLIARAGQSLKKSRELLKIDEGQVPAEIDVDAGDTPAERIIQRVLKEDFDLVVKNVEGRNHRKGFKAMDMELLRKCPCPVWLSRRIEHPREEVRVVVAVDPEHEQPSAYDLSIRLLRLSRALADSCSGTLHVVSCWDYDVDEYLRHNYPINISDEELDRALEKAGSKHRGKLDALIHAAGIEGPMEVHHAIARPDSFIPLLIEEKQLDILVMGTVGRTGIPGFIMGNTAENILQHISCSLLALKPSDYKSPVKV
ncbi:universal stress protein [Microbulbifer guangxiensis]|uniref:universal stress protein n=1 Tax=Microbulbifer guangxiensis TaxID=2904249 RepID=UPI001F244CD5|nr:universal stress protein [Microbulbifer guangxiensis]